MEGGRGMIDKIFGNIVICLNAAVVLLSLLAYFCCGVDEYGYEYLMLAGFAFVLALYVREVKRLRNKEAGE